MKIHQIIFSPTGGTQRVSEILLFMLLTFFLVYTQTTEAKGQYPCFSFENYCLRDYLKTASLLVIRKLWQKKE